VTFLSTGQLAVANDIAFKLYIEESGIYAVGHDELVEAGLDSGEIDSSLVGVSNRGEAVPIHLNDGGDGRFGPGDSFEFAAQRLAVPGLYYHPYSKYNVYWLGFDGSSARRTESRTTSASAEEAEVPSLVRVIHHERDHLLIRVRESEMKSTQDSDLWFSAKLTNIYDTLKRVKLRMIGMDPLADASVDLRIGVRGLSRPRLKGGAKVPHHSLDVAVNDFPIGNWEWDGRSAHVVEIPGLDPGMFREGPNRVELNVPSRTPEGMDEAIVDVVMLNWVEVSYPHSGRIGRGQIELQIADVALPASSVDGRVVELAASTSAVVYTGDGTRIEPLVVFQGPRGEIHRNRVRFDVGEASSFLVTVGRHKQVGLIERDRPSSLLDTTHSADYLVISHRRLLEAVAPLVELHRDRGLEVAVVDVDDVYDEFNHGILDPTAIRDFVSYAYHRWSPPAPRFVLLVGDASWDTKNTTADDRNYADWAERDIALGGRFVRNDVPVYAEKAALNHRQLVPTWNYTSHEGHSASDNYFVTVDGPDFYPDLAIGRLPVTEVEEVEAIVRKTTRYLTEAEVGPWRRNILWITNESTSFQKSSDIMAFGMGQRGYSASKVYPSSEEEDNEAHQPKIQQMLGDGQLIVHFLGHGGRHIWRTGPPDYRKNHDLFTLDHVAALDPSERLAFIMSMTCYSAPFDHPNQDSIGEMFLRVPDRGAVGVFGASWRNSPIRTFSQALLDELTTPGAKVGEAIMRAKRVTRNRVLVETYNLLGDPAVELAVPPRRVEVIVEKKRSKLRVSGTTDFDAAGARALLEWVDEDLEVLHAEELKVRGSEFGIAVAQRALPEDDKVAGVRVYVWHEGAGWDAMGWWPPADVEDTAEPKVASKPEAQRPKLEAEHRHEGKDSQ
jgi:hypothetical protein